MITEQRTAKERKYEKVYRAYADDIYRMCLHYLRDEKRAQDAAVQVFFNHYKTYDGTSSDNVFGCLVNEFKRLLLSEEGKKLVVEELRECTTNGKN